MSKSKKSKYRSTYNKRRDASYSPYVKGVFHNGEKVIRSLNDEEKAWLDKFNDEFVNTNLKRDGTDLHADLIEESKKILEPLKEQLEKVNDDIDKLRKSYTRHKGNGYRIRYGNTLRELSKMKFDLEYQIYELDVIRQIYRDNNARSRDPFNFKQSMCLNIIDMFSSESDYKSESELWDVFYSNMLNMYGVKND